MTAPRHTGTPVHDQVLHDLYLSRLLDPPTGPIPEVRMPSPSNPALVPALVTLRDQFNRRYPRRSKASDGWIGDPAHAARTSYHNPDRNGWVHAIDITHDRAVGLDIDRITDELVASRDGRILELIANGLYWHFQTPKWVKYTGASPHDHHFHITCKPGVATAMDARPWNLASFR